MNFKTFEDLRAAKQPTYISSVTEKSTGYHCTAPSTQSKTLSLHYNRLERYCAAHIVHSCQQDCSALLHLIAG